MDKYERRRRNLAALREARCGGKSAEMARLLGRDASYVSRMLYPEGKAGGKRIADDMREHIEQSFGLPPYWLDQPVGLSINTDSRPETDTLSLNGLGRKCDPDQASDFGTEVAIQYRGIPVVGMAQFGNDGFFEELQYPTGFGDGLVQYPSRDVNAYALRGNGNSMAPRFRHGEFIIVEPGTEVHPGDEVMVRLTSGRTMGKVFAYARDGMHYFDSINLDHAQVVVPSDQIEKMHFIAGVAKRSLYQPPS